MSDERDRARGPGAGGSGAQGARGGMPGDGAGRRDEVGHTGVYPFGSEDAPAQAEVRESGSWGRSDWAASGTSEIARGPGGEALGGADEGSAALDTRDTPTRGGTTADDAAGRGDARAGLPAEPWPMDDGDDG